jgi:hypothetical protein
MKTFAPVAALFVFGCAMATAMIKAPVESKCAGYGLKGCDVLVDGVVMYIDGNKEGATLKLKQAAAKNSPAQIRPFAKAIKSIVPGEDGALIAEILSGEVEAHARATAEATDSPGRPPAPSAGSASALPVASAPPPEDKPRSTARMEHVDLALAAPLDPSRLVTSSAAPLRDAAKTVCEVAGTYATCVRLDQGPIVLTDAISPTACKTELYVGAADSTGKTVWVIQANSPGLHGGRYLVRSDQRIMVAARGVGMQVEGDDRCFVTWAGFRPRMVPLNIAPVGDTE